MKNTKLQRNLVVLAVALAFILVITMVIQFVMIGVESTRTKQLEAELAKLNTNVESIGDEVDYYKTMMYIEKCARENLDMYGEGDIIFKPKA